MKTSILKKEIIMVEENLCDLFKSLVNHDGIPIIKHNNRNGSYVIIIKSKKDLLMDSSNPICLD